MDLRNKPVDELELTVRTYHCLKNANIQTIGELLARTEWDLLRSKTFGRKSLNEIRKVLSDFGLRLRTRDDDDNADISTARQPGKPLRPASRVQMTKAEDQ